MDQCIEDPENPHKLICDYDNLWILIIITNVAVLIPLILIKLVPNEEDLDAIGDELQVTYDETDNIEELKKDEMISLYWICIDRCKCCRVNNGQFEKIDNESYDQVKKEQDTEDALVNVNTEEEAEGTL